MTPTEIKIELPPTYGQWRAWYTALLENAWTGHVVDVMSDERANELSVGLALAEEIRHGLAAGLLGYSPATPPPATTPAEIHHDGGRCYCRYGGDGRQINIDDRCITARRAAFTPGAGPTGNGDQDLADAAARDCRDPWHSSSVRGSSGDPEPIGEDCPSCTDERAEPNGEQADPIVPNRRTCTCRGCSAARASGMQCAAVES